MSIYYYCPTPKYPVGGHKQTFRHVEALRDAGIEAYVLMVDEVSPSWFDTDAPIAEVQTWRNRVGLSILNRRTKLGWWQQDDYPVVRVQRANGNRVTQSMCADDFIVVPDFLGKYLTRPSYDIHTAIFAQGTQFTFSGFGADEQVAGFLHDEGSPIICVSHHIKRYMEFTFPTASCYLAPNGVDGTTFRPAPKKPQIAFMPRKLSHVAVQVFQMLRRRASLAGWSLAPIDRVDEQAVARILGESRIFLSTCSEEGFGLPPLEAAFAECSVVGFTGQGAAEFMLPELCYPVDDGDVLGLAAMLERVISLYERDERSTIERARRHSEFVRDRYNLNVERDQIVTGWRQILGSTPP